MEQFPFLRLIWPMIIAVLVIAWLWQEFSTWLGF